MAEVATVAASSSAPAVVGPAQPARKLELRQHQVDRIVNKLYEYVPIVPSMLRDDVLRQQLGDATKDEVDAALRELQALGRLGQNNNWHYQKKR